MSKIRKAKALRPLHCNIFKNVAYCELLIRSPYEFTKKANQLLDGFYITPEILYFDN